MLRNIRNSMVEFHRDDEGMETVQIIMILAIAAMVCLGVNSVAGTSATSGGSGSGIFGSITNIVSQFLPGVVSWIGG